MKGLIVTKEQELKLVGDIPMPELGDYECLVKIETCMICNGTDLGILAGQVREAGEYPLVLGHESAGRVVEAGAKVTSFRVGDRVLRPAQKVSERYFSSWGGFAEYGVVIDYPAIQRDGAQVPGASVGITQQVVPAGISAEQASLAITLKETYSQVKEVRRDYGSMLVLGDGPVGLSVVCAARLLGIPDIYMIGNHTENLEAARQMGVREVFLGKDPAQRALAQERFSGSMELCFDTIGSSETVNQCAGYLRECGTVAVYGLHSEPVLPLALPPLRNYDIRFMQWPVPQQEAACHDAVCAAILAGDIDCDAFVTHRLPLAEFAQGFRAIRERKARKVVLLIS